MTLFDQTLLIVGATLLALGLASGLIKNRWYVSEPVIALGVGVLVGPVGFGVLRLEEWGDPATILEQGARLTLAIALVDIAVSLPTDFLRRRWRTLLVMLGLVMPAMWAVSGGLAYFIVEPSLWMALLLGAVVTPTDPVVASSIVTGTLAEKSAPAPVRRTIISESGANDALALPLVMLPILMLTKSTGEALTEWFIVVLLWDVVAATIIGAIAGWAAGRLLRWSQSRKDSERSSLLTVTLALAITLIGGVHLMGSDGLLAAFVAGLMLNRQIKGDVESQKERLHEAIKRFFELPIFLILGFALPWSEWQELGWKGVAFVIAILALRRIPAVLMLRRLLPPLKTRRDAFFVGWFGPIGIAALYYAQLAKHEAEAHDVWVVASLVVATSVFIHGVSATALTKAYGRATDRTPAPGEDADDDRNDA